MPWLTPPNDEGCKSVVLTMPQNAAWLACFMGALLSLTYEYNWEQNTDTDMTPADTAQKWLEIYLAIQNCEGCVITDVRLTATGLEAKYCDSDTWVDKGDLMRYGVRVSDGAIQFDLDGDNTYEITQYLNFNSADYQNGLAPITDVDRLCYTAQKMADDILDDFQDAMQILDYNTTVVFGTITAVADSLFSSLPVQIATAEMGLVLDAALEIIYQVSDAALDYIILQSSDPDVKSLVANFIFCALKDSLVTGEDGITEVVGFESNLIARMGAYYVAINTLGSVDVGYEMDFGEALEGLLDSSNFVIAGLACSYVLAEVFFLDALGLKDNWKSVILGYQQQAEYFDSRDCDDFDCLAWCYEWDFLTADGWEYVPYPSSPWTGSPMAVWNSGVGWEDILLSATNKRYGYLWIRILFSEATQITKVSYTGSIDYGTGAGKLNSVYAYTNSGHTTTSLLEAYSTSSGAETWTWDGSESIYGVLIAIYSLREDNTNPNLVALLESAKIEGTGEMPAFTQGSLC